MDDDGDAEPRAPESDPLDIVHESGALTRPQAGRRADAGNLPDPMRHPGGNGIGVERALAQQVGAPEAPQLRQLLVERHALQEIVDTRVDCRRGILVYRCRHGLFHAPTFLLCGGRLNPTLWRPPQRRAL